ncbi:MAG: extracellular matrix regulator RemB [Desulfitobacteriia bacterium]|jgi:hypothetical protein
MFLHLGNNFMLRKDKIIAILDLETTVNNNLVVQNLINDVLKKGEARLISEENKEKSLVITDDGFYLSPISSVTLQKRSIIETM